MTADARPWSVLAHGVTVRVRVTPKSSRDDVGGIETTAQGAALKVRVRAVPDKGAANAAVTATLADWLGVPKSTVTLLSGSTARIKSIAIAGDGAQLSARLEQRLGADA
jgi:uncharacterized protein YggU (UPF0235/DUF167 family)